MKDLSEITKDVSDLKKLLALPRRLAAYLSIPGSGIKLIIDGENKTTIAINIYLSVLESEMKFNKKLFQYQYSPDKIIIRAINPDLLDNETLLEKPAIEIQSQHATVVEQDSTKLQTVSNSAPLSISSLPPSLAATTMFAPANAKLPSSMPPIMSNPANDLASSFVTTYQSQLKDITEANKNITIAKLAGYAIVRQLVAMGKTDGLIMSYLGRSIIAFHQLHQKNFSVPPFGNKSDAVSRLQFVIVENPQGCRAIIDLGSAFGTQVKYREEVTDDDFYKTCNWFSSIGAKVLNELDKDEDKIYQTCCPMYARIKEQTVAYVEKATTMPVAQPLRDYPLKLQTNQEKIGWLPIPPGYDYELIIGGPNSQIKIGISKNTVPAEDVTVAFTTPK